jgi:hypothetical protein
MEKSKKIMEEEKELFEKKGESNDGGSFFRISIWRMHGGKLPLMESKLDLKSSEQFSIFGDVLYFSHDSNIIFILI